MAQKAGNQVISSAPVRSSVVVDQHRPQIVVISNLGRDPAFITCPFCQKQTLTKIEFKPNSSTHAAAFNADMCCCLPYCMDDLQSAHHYCDLCKTFIGKCD